MQVPFRISNGNVDGCHEIPVALITSVAKLTPVYLADPGLGSSLRSSSFRPMSFLFSLFPIIN